MSSPGGRGGRDRLAGVLQRHPVLTRAALALAIAAATWPVTVRPNVIGLDASWAVALHLAVRDGLAWGRDLVFTYGPLGFLGVLDPWMGPTAIAALAAVGAIHLTTCALLVRALERVVSLPLAAAGAFLVAQTFIQTDAFTLLTGLVALVCVDAIAGRLPLASRPALVAAALGLLGAVAFLGKLNAGMFVGAMGLVTAASIGRPAWRSVAAFGLSGGAGGLALWILAGGSPSDIEPWLRGAMEVVSGYSAVMGVDVSVTSHWRYLAFAGALGLIAWHAVEASASWPAVRRWGLLALIAVMALATWKVGFVRWYSAYAFILLAVLLAGVLAPSRGRRTAIVSWVLAYVLIMASASVPPSRILDPRPALRTLRDQAAAVVVPGRSVAAADAVRTRQREQLAIEPQIIEALRGHSVHVDPTQTAVLNAYPELAWRPLPVFQSYSAYTPSLDALNAAALRASDAPERILREAPHVRPGQRLEVPVTIDGRFRWWEAPAATLETWCRYSEVVATSRWQVLARTDDGCGSPVALATVEASAGWSIAVPDAPPGAFLVLRIRGLEPSPLEQLGTTLFKPHEWYAWLDGRRHRLVQTTAADGLLLAVPADDPSSAPFAFGPQVRTLLIGTGPAGTSTLRPLTFEFVAVPGPQRAG